VTDSLNRRTNAVGPDAIAERRAHILTEASLIIARAGVAGCSFAGLAEACGHSVGMIQHYFRTRERLIQATVEFRINSSVEEWHTVYATGGDSLQRIHDLLTFSIEGRTPFEEAWGFWVAVFAEGHKDRNIGESVAKALVEWHAIFVEALKAAVAEGVVPADLDTERSAYALVAVIEGLAIQTLNGLHGGDPAVVIDLLHAIASRELGIDPELLRGAASEEPRR
jgi:TetR/AcrR family transcriptional repressor of bet genes